MFIELGLPCLFRICLTFEYPIIICDSCDIVNKISKQKVQKQIKFYKLYKNLDFIFSVQVYYLKSKNSCWRSVVVFFYNFFIVCFQYVPTILYNNVN